MLPKSYGQPEQEVIFFLFIKKKKSDSNKLISSPVPPKSVKKQNKISGPQLTKQTNERYKNENDLWWEDRAECRKY